MKRVGVFLDPEDYKKIKAKLILEGTTFSAWIRKVIKEKLGV